MEPKTVLNINESGGQAPAALKVQITLFFLMSAYVTLSLIFPGFFGFPLTLLFLLKTNPLPVLTAGAIVLLIMAVVSGGLFKLKRLAYYAMVLKYFIDLVWVYIISSDLGGLIIFFMPILIVESSIVFSIWRKRALFVR